MLTLVHPQAPRSVPIWPLSSSRASAPCVWSEGPQAQFGAMSSAYSVGGGMASADELVSLASARSGPDVAQLARWIVERSVIGFEWKKQFWLPLFQFSAEGMAPRADLAPILGELVPAMDAWALAVWFARPNHALAGRSPLQVLPSDPSAVHDAARLARFVAHG